MIEHACDEGDYLIANPCRVVSKKEVEKVGDTNSREAWWKPETALDILRETLSPPNGRSKLRTGDEKELFEVELLGLWTGLRANELLLLQVVHFDPETKAITLVARTGRRSKIPVTHYIRVPDECVRLLKDRSKGKAKGDLIFPSFWKETPDVYPKTKEEREKLRLQTNAAVTALGQRLGYVIKRLHLNDGITDKRFLSSEHTIRHTAITWKMILTNGDVPTTQRFARHRKVEMTMRYTHYLEQDLTSVRKGLADFWKNLGRIVYPKPAKIVPIR